MKQKDIKIGGVYRAKVTNKQVDVRIEAERHTGGWDATNLATHKKIVIKTAQRLTEKKSVTNSKATNGTKVTTTGNVTVVETVPATVETIGGTSTPLELPAADKRVAKKFRKPPESDAAPREKKLSCIDAAIKVLEESSQPMNAKEMIDAMEAKGYWSSPGGKTPHATLYSAILRELAKGDQSRFAKADRGHFTTNRSE